MNKQTRQTTIQYNTLLKGSLKKSGTVPLVLRFCKTLFGDANGVAGVKALAATAALDMARSSGAFGIRNAAGDMVA